MSTDQTQPAESTEPFSEAAAFPLTALLFLGGAAVTAIFSGSLMRLTERVGWVEVIVVGMVVPCFTWFVQLGASGVLLAGRDRANYWRELGWACFWGSCALVPMGIANIVDPETPRLLSAANVLASVALMTIYLFRTVPAHGLSPLWPASFLATITVNMCLFLLSSWHWWQ